MLYLVVYVCVYIFVYLCISVSMSVYICIYITISMYTCPYIHIYTLFIHISIHIQDTLWMLNNIIGTVGLVHTHTPDPNPNPNPTTNPTTNIISHVNSNYTFVFDALLSPLPLPNNPNPNSNPIAIELCMLSLHMLSNCGGRYMIQKESIILLHNCIILL